MEDKKKRIERFYLDEFLKLLGEKPDKIYEGETPDFVLELNQLSIGIELTEFHSDLKGDKGYPRRLIEESWTSLQQDIMKAVCKDAVLEKTNGFLTFKELDLPPKSKYDEFIEELIQLSHEMLESNHDKIKPGSAYPLLNKYLKQFYLKRVDCYITWEWNHISSFIGLTETELIKTIQPKIKKSKHYRKNDLDELWLIIVSGTNLSQTMPTHLGETLRTFDTTNAILSESFFNKVFIYQYMLYVLYEWPEWIQIGEEKLYPTINA